MTRTSERSLLLLLATVQFTHIMDFMIMMPLGPQLMRNLDIGPGRFSALVSAYTISAGLVGLCAAPFIDRYDRRRLLLFNYAGFVVGTLACALSHTAGQLLVARAVCGGFGGVSGATIMAIVSDIVPPARRGAAMGFIMTAFSVAAALGVPFGLFLAREYVWEAPFFFVAGLSALVWGMIFAVLPPVRGHLASLPIERFGAFLELLRDANAGRALVFMASLIVGHFMIVPLLSPHLVHNVGLPEKQLFLVYLAGGVCSVFSAPLVGKLADGLGLVRVFTVLVIIACGVVVLLANAGPLPLWAVLGLSGMFFMFASGRFVPGQAIMSLAVPPSHRGAFMSLTSCTRDLAAGLTSSFGGWVVTESPTTGRLLHFDVLGWVAVAAGGLSLWLVRRVRAVETGPVAVDPI